ncbi:hypothetical protein DFJ58DRAFT_142084 [Suillus subalutaceus]|uniref:uncharacterized protein n=1 Tax=Suillus subalutaceus TaxID=48586 RepID=UPI001B881588|nr:uncharacterized protein DFJ58DRAFT_142084 [Suillus subalutaceus]KAG1866600.1 hypothetical protein DFJ58DRAFT_142084 [Suillus subalutaceus]
MMVNVQRLIPRKQFACILLFPRVVRLSPCLSVLHLFQCVSPLFDFSPNYTPVLYHQGFRLLLIVGIQNATPRASEPRNIQTSLTVIHGKRPKVNGSLV